MSKPLSPDRLEAFSDGVIAVIITIMVLELHVPGKEVSNLDGLRALLPLLARLSPQLRPDRHLLGQPPLPRRRPRPRHPRHPLVQPRLPLLPLAHPLRHHLGRQPRHLALRRLALRHHLRVACRRLDHPLHRHLSHHPPTPRRQPRQAGLLHSAVSRRCPGLLLVTQHRARHDRPCRRPLARASRQSR